MGTAERTGLTRQAFVITQDLMRPRPAIYWADLIASAGLTYVGLATCILAPSIELRLMAGLLSVLALYRAASFIHEITHLRADDVPGFTFGWNLLVGVPFMIPSFMYEGIHNQHHAKDRFGTSRDPEYLPLAQFGPGRLAGFLAVALLAPVALVLRFGVAAPLSFLIPAVRRWTLAHASALTINPGFVRQDSRASGRRAWLAQEIACWLWCWTLIASTLAGWISPSVILTAAAVVSVAAFVNQLRTVVAHYWENDGDQMSFEAQFRDSVNVPPPNLLAEIWAPVGLRYHALHHLLPRLPYHNLAAAHRRLAQTLPLESGYGDVEEPGLVRALGALFARAAARQRA